MLPISPPSTAKGLHDRLDWVDWRPTLIAAALVTLLVAAIVAGFGSVSAFERPQVLASLIDSIYWLGGAFIGACSTIAALTLTTLSLIEHLDTRRMGPRFLVHLRLAVIAAFATIALSVSALVLTIFPSATGGEASPPTWQVNFVYYGLLTLTALMVGGFAVVLTSLYATIADVFRNLPERWVDDILADPSAREESTEALPRDADRAEGNADRAGDAAAGLDDAAPHPRRREPIGVAPR